MEITKTASTGQSVAYWWRALIVAALGAVVAASYACGVASLLPATSGLPESREGHLVALNTDLGAVWQEDPFKARITVVNTGTAEARVTEAVGSCSCTTLTPHAFVLAPGQSAELTLTVPLNGRGSLEGPWRLSHDVMLLYASPGRDAPHVFTCTVTAELRAAVTFLPPSLTVTATRCPLPACTIDIRCEAPVTSLLPHCDPSNATVALEEVAGAMKMYVSLNPERSRELTAFSIGIIARLRDGTTIHLPDY